MTLTDNELHAVLLFVAVAAMVLARWEHHRLAVAEERLGRTVEAVAEAHMVVGVVALSTMLTAEEKREVLTTYATRLRLTLTESRAADGTTHAHVKREEDAPCD